VKRNRLQERSEQEGNRARPAKKESPGRFTRSDRGKTLCRWSGPHCHRFGSHRVLVLRTAPSEQADVKKNVSTEADATGVATRIQEYIRTAGSHRDGGNICLPWQNLQRQILRSRKQSPTGRAREHHESLLGGAKNCVDRLTLRVRRLD
jgi:hypothetical protein